MTDQTHDGLARSYLLARDAFSTGQKAWELFLHTRDLTQKQQALAADTIIATQMAQLQIWSQDAQEDDQVIIGAYIRTCNQWRHDLNEYSKLQYTSQEKGPNDNDR